MDILKELESAGAVLLGRHFVYKSGKHGSGYINMDPTFPNTEMMWKIGAELWFEFAEDPPETVAAPAIGAIGLAYAMAYALRYELGGPVVAVVWADKIGDNFVFERAGFVDHLTGKRVLVVEDLLTTGGSVIKVCREAEKHGAEIIGVSATVNRGGVTAKQLGVPRLESLASVNFSAVDPRDCELCASGVPIVEDIGHGGAYKATHPDYAGGYIKLL